MADVNKLIGILNRREMGGSGDDPKPKSKVKSEEVNKKKYTPDDAEDIKKWYKEYYKSDLFKKNLYDQGNAFLPEEGDAVSKSLIDKLNGLQYTYNDVNMAGLAAPTAYDRYNTINLGNPNNYENQSKSGTFAHEMAHVNQTDILSHQPRNMILMLNRNKLGKRKSDANDVYNIANSMPPRYSDGRLMYPDLSSVGLYRKFNLNDWMNREETTSSTSAHDDNIGEVRADIMAMRYLAAKKGIWDASKKQPGTFTPEMLNKLFKEQELNTPMTRIDAFGNKTTTTVEGANKQGNLKNVAPPKNPGMFLQRLRTRYNDSDILYLMNNLAKNQVKDKNENQV
jgi:hypothetical protein